MSKQKCGYLTIDLVREKLNKEIKTIILIKRLSVRLQTKWLWVQMPLQITGFPIIGGTTENFHSRYSCS